MKIQHRNKEYKIHFIKRPFREGLEARVEINGEQVVIAEMGLGKLALIERIKAEIDRRMGDTARD